MTNFYLNVLNKGKRIHDINKTNIVLIPKVDAPKNMRQYKLINLCTIIYKIISRVLVNRFQNEETQGAFVLGRQITNNILITNEVLHLLEKKKGKVDYFALKLDMSKTHDRVEWSFLQDMMTCLSFYSDWINLILRCVRSVYYLVILNGRKEEEFTPSKA